MAINGYKLIYFFSTVVLALIPCGIVYIINFKIKNSWQKTSLTNKLLFVFLFIIWFFFFPNTVYLFTKIRYIIGYCSSLDPLVVCPESVWMMIFFFFHALIGLPCFYCALKIMKNVLSRLSSKATGQILPIIMIPISSIGIMIGLLGRYNSSDLLFHPIKIARETVSYLNDPNIVLNIFVFTIFLYIIYYCLDYLLKINKIKQK
ncbi:MAG: DUF1361 domain-containing protein [Patescibacteria group bacterium]